MTKSQTPLRQLKEKARLLQANGQLRDAISHWRNILLARPDDVDALYSMGRALLTLGRLAEAEASLRVAVERAPQRAEIWITLSRIQRLWGNEEAAEESLHNAIARQSDHPHAHQALGELKLRQGRVMEAMAAFQTALTLEEGFPPALIGMGKGWWLRGQAEEAERHLREAVKSAPKYSESHLQLALLLLSTGKGAEGWRELEWRQGAQTQLTEAAPIPDPKINKLPLWDGHALESQILLVTHEGGLCEALQFFRLLNQIPAQHVIYRCPAALKSLLQGSHGKVTLSPDDTPPPVADLQVPLLSLPHLLNMDKPKTAKPYLRADPTELSPWRKKLGDGVRIGICWKGGNRPFDNGVRHVPLAYFQPLADLDGVTLVSLQKGDGRQEMDEVPFPIHDYESELDEGMQAFLDSAALISALTLVISVDGAIAHLAGALGRPVWTLLPAGPAEWRWQAEGRETPWYPTMDLFAPDSGEGWEDLMAGLAHRLNRMMAGDDPDQLG